MAADKIIKDARICSKNFSGKPDKYNPNGFRQFTVILDEDEGMDMLEEGWNVKRKPGREPGDPDRFFLKVTVRFDKFPPVVKLVTSKNITTLDEDTVGQLDTAIITKIDLALSKRYWEVNGNTGYKAYLKTGYFTIEEDEFEDEYDMYD